MVYVSVFAMLIFLGISLQATLLALREPRRTRRLHAFTWAAGSFALGSAALASFFYLYEADSGIPLLAQAGKTLTIIALGMTSISFIVWVYFLIQRHRSIVAGESPHHRMPVAKRIRFLYLLAQPDWERLNMAEFSREDRRDASNSTRIIGVGAALITFPGILLLLSASILMNIRGSATSDFAAHTLGYYTLLIATCWTVVYLVTLALVSIQQVLRDQGSDLSLTNVVVSVGTWAGFGAAGGVFVGALIPIVVLLIPKGPFEALDVTLLDTISPDLLLNISAAGAVIGFLLGEAISVTTFADGEKNLITQTVLPPMVFGITATGLGLVGLRPGAISSYLSRQYKTEFLSGKFDASNPFSTAAHVDLDTSEGWAALVASFDRNGWNTFIDRHLYFWTTWSVVALVILFTFTVEVHRRELKLADMETKEEARTRLKAERQAKKIQKKKKDQLPRSVPKQSKQKELE